MGTLLVEYLYSRQRFSGQAPYSNPRPRVALVMGGSNGGFLIQRRDQRPTQVRDLILQSLVPDKTIVNTSSIGKHGSQSSVGSFDRSKIEMWMQNVMERHWYSFVLLLVDNRIGFL